METVASTWMWAAFSVFVLGMLALDLGVFHRKDKEVSFKDAFGWTIVWIALAGLFNIGVWWKFGTETALEFTTAYLIEKALSVDNIFVFLVLFASFAVPRAYQHRVLFWGVLGALVLRAVFIVAGAALLQRFHWVIYVFGGLLLVTGIKLMLQSETDIHPERNPLYRFARRLIPSVSTYDGHNFFTIQNGKRFATPLFLVLLAIEATDVVFAVDSIPAIFAITTDPFIVYTSNIFAILGLRSLYFVLAGMMEKFHYLKIGLALVLVFVGAKMMLADFVKIPIVVSLGTIAGILAVAVAFSLLRARRIERRELRRG
jgi:tellurite resistance protein TerC